MRIFPVCLLLLLYLLTFSKPSHAALMHVLDAADSFQGSRYDDLHSFNIKIGDLSPLFIGGGLAEIFGETLTFDHLVGGPLTEMLTRTLPMPDDPNSDHLSDTQHMMLFNEFVTWVEIWPEDPDYGHGYQGIFYDSIPDYSGYDISGYYLTQSWFDDGTTMTFHLELLADATPVAAPIPEPSTLITLFSGAMVCALIGWRSRHRNSISP